MIFEVQKNVEEHLLVKNTAFKGKDSAGEEVFYTLTEDVVLNKGSVKSLKNIFVKKANGTKQIFASPVANSEDGLGAELESADGSWKTFGDPDTSPVAETGFIIASHYLYLNEGEREITFKFYSPESETIDFSVEDLYNLFSLQLTGEKGWVDVTINSSDITIDSAKEYFSIAVSLDGGVDAIIPYSKETHGGNYDVNLPLAKFILNNASAIDSVWDFTLSKIEIELYVSEIRNVAIQNDAGVLDPSKPFELFTTVPHIGSSFILGNKELFLKANTSSESISGKINLTWDNYDELTANLKWIGKSDYFTHTTYYEPYTVSLEFFNNAVWEMYDEELNLIRRVSDYDMEDDIEEEVNDSVNINFSLIKLECELDFTANENYSVTSKWGFIRMNTNYDFGQTDYQTSLKNIVELDSSNQIVKINPINYPYIPKAKDLTLEYTAKITLDFSQENTSVFFHLTPFGYRKISNSDDDIFLLPQFENEGELFIGLEDLKPEQTLSVLFQVSEGSADPLESKQELSWYYLDANNDWLAFENEDIADATDDLTNSGIIKFNIPNGASTENTMMTDQLIWLKVSIPEKTNAVCNLIEIIAQAAKAQFTDYKNTGSYFKLT